MTPRELLISGAEELGAPLTMEQVNSVFVFLTELKKWNRKINLTAIRNERDTIIKHALDSLSYGRGFTPQAGQRLLDMGSGAGFPAIVLKIAHPEIDVTLVESIKKKVAFLRHVVRLLDITGIEIIGERTENLSDSYCNIFDIVTARAFADLEKALEIGTRFLKPTGLMVLSRGPEETLNQDTSDRYGVALDNKVALTLPHSDYKRMIWVFRRD